MRKPLTQTISLTSRLPSTDTVLLQLSMDTPSPVLITENQIGSNTPVDTTGTALVDTKGTALVDTTGTEGMKQTSPQTTMSLSMLVTRLQMTS